MSEMQRGSEEIKRAMLQRQ